MKKILICGSARQVASMTSSAAIKKKNKKEKNIYSDGILTCVYFPNKMSLFSKVLHLIHDIIAEPFAANTHCHNDHADIDQDMTGPVNTYKQMYLSLGGRPLKTSTTRKNLYKTGRINQKRNYITKATLPH